MKIFIAALMATLFCGCATKRADIASYYRSNYKEFIPYGNNYQLNDTNVSSNITIEKDEFNSNWYISPDRRYTYSSGAPVGLFPRITIDPYLGYNEKHKKSFFRLVFSYSDKDWLFFRKAILLCNNKTHTIKFNQMERKTKIDSGIREWYDISADQATLNFLEGCSDGKIQLTGENRRYSEMILSYISTGVKELRFINKEISKERLEKLKGLQK